MEGNNLIVLNGGFGVKAPPAGSCQVVISHYGRWRTQRNPTNTPVRTRRTPEGKFTDDFPTVWHVLFFSLMHAHTNLFSSFTIHGIFSVIHKVQTEQKNELFIMLYLLLVQVNVVHKFSSKQNFILSFSYSENAWSGNILQTRSNTYLITWMIIHLCLRRIRMARTHWCQIFKM